MGKNIADLTKQIYFLQHLHVQEPTEGNQHKREGELPFILGRGLAHKKEAKILASDFRALVSPARRRAAKFARACQIWFMQVSTLSPERPCMQTTMYTLVFGLLCAAMHACMATRKERSPDCTAKLSPGKGGSIHRPCPGRGPLARLSPPVPRLQDSPCEYILDRLKPAPLHDALHQAPS